MAAVSSASYRRGTTNTAAALRYLYNDMFTVSNGDRLSVPNIAVVFTDGESNEQKSTMEVIRGFGNVLFMS